MATLKSKNIFQNYVMLSVSNAPFRFYLAPPNLNFVLHYADIRVAISQKANEIDLPDTTKIVTRLLIYNAQVLLLLEDLLTPD